jgi:Aspartyl protease
VPGAISARRHTRVLPFHQRYISYNVENEHQRLPLLHVRLIGPTKESFTTIALVDSGATTTFIPPELAEAVGLARHGPDEPEGVPATGAGGSFPNDLFTYDIDIMKGGKAFLRISGVAMVPREKGRIPYAVLGRDNLFRIYDITFREQRQLIVMRPASH